MPWTPSEATKHTKKATTEKLRRLWADVANDTLDRTGKDGDAVRAANAAVNRATQTKRKSK